MSDLPIPAGADEVARCIDDACAACAIAAPTGHESNRGRWIAEQLTAAGLSPVLDAAGNVIVHFGSDRGPVVVAAHMDTVFGDLTDISVCRDGPVLRAPGIGDNSLGVAGLLFLARRASHLSWANRLPLTLAATVGEEGLGNLFGSKALVEQLQPSAFVALEGGFQDDLIIRGVGSSRFEIVVRTPGGHSWTNRGEPSAVHTLVGILAGLLDRYPTASINIGAVSGGDGINVLAREAIAAVEFRDLSNRKLELAERLLFRLTRSGRATRSGPARSTGAGSEPVSVEVKTLGIRQGGRISQRHRLVRAALDARVDAGLSRPRFAEASTDANAALARSVPAMTIGLAHCRGAHSPDECVDVTALNRGLGAAWGLVDRATMQPDGGQR